MSKMKIIIEFNKEIDYFTDKENLKRLIDREDFNERLKTVIDNGIGLNIKSTFGQWVYTIVIEKDKNK